MTRTQKHLLLFTAGILLLALTLFQEKIFAQSDVTIWLYRLLAIGGLLLSAGSLGRLFGRRMMWVFLIALILSEILLAILFRASVSGTALPQKVTDMLGYIYLHRCRDYVMYDNERGQYDEDVFYTLKPGEFEYSNMEFSTKYEVNKSGYRDDGNSFLYPELIFLGDSYTMGWGVEQDESFAALLENKLNLRGLNTGIASYGTAREYLTFKKIKSDSCKLLVLQFCPNDVRENRQFVEAGGQLETSPQAKFNQEVIWNKLYQKYYPLKYVHSVLYFFAEKIKPKPIVVSNEDSAPPHGIAPSEVDDFFFILKKIRATYAGPIIIFNLGMGVTESTVTKQFKKWLAENPMPGVYVFPTSQYLEKEDYLPLDTHLTVEGNRKVGEGLKGFIDAQRLLSR